MMATQSPDGRSTRVSRLVRAPRHTVYQALVDPQAVAQWLAPDTMTGTLHVFEPRVGGRIRMSLRYTDPADSPGGKSSEDTDTFEGRFIELVPDERVVWLTVFDSPDPDFAGEMRITFSLAEADGGTQVTCLCEDIPPGIRLEDNVTGTEQSLRKLGVLME